MVKNINPKSVIGQSYINPVIERFKGSEKLFVAYLIDNKKELRHVFRLATKFKDIKFLIIPSKISEEILNNIIAEIKRETLLYSECGPDTNFSKTQCLVIDYFGETEKILQYGTWFFMGKESGLIRRNIAAMTMVRNDRFLLKWIDYYGSRLGYSNLYVFFDGDDQVIPSLPEGVNVKIIPKMQGSVVETDRMRARFMSKFAADLLSFVYEMVIATDADEFLIVDPLCKIELTEYLSGLPHRSCYSGLGVDILQHIPEEKAIDFSRHFLSQRQWGWLNPRYTKSSIIMRPVVWGGGYHRIKHRNFHIAKDLYLFHFGGFDMESLRVVSDDASRLSSGWRNHQLKRFRQLVKVSSIKAKRWGSTVKLARKIQTFFRPLFAINKPSTLGIKLVVKIPRRFANII